jgi:DNA polymerase/3'-5' exonuclease PolX
MFTIQPAATPEIEIVLKPESEGIGPKDNLIAVATAKQAIWAFCKRMRTAIPGDWSIQEAGSIRRGHSWVHDIDLIVVLPDSMDNETQRKAISAFIKSDWDWAIHVDWRFCTDNNIGAMLLYLTGDAQHNIIMRYHAKQKGLFLNEYGLWGNTGWPSHETRLLAAKTEKAIYKRLGLCWIPPSQRSFKVLKQQALKLTPWVCSECEEGMTDYRAWKDSATCQVCINSHIAKGELP